MSFFIKHKGNQEQSGNPGTRKRKKLQKKSIEKSKVKHGAAKDDDEITSSSSEDEGLATKVDEAYESAEDEHETAQEKKLRLAKVYLKEIEAQERKKREKEETEQLEQDEHDNSIRQRLKSDHLKQTGRFRTTIADSLQSCPKVTVLRGKEHRNAVCCACITDDDKLMYSGSKDGGIIKWSLETYSKVAALPYVKETNEKSCKLGHSSSILAIAVSFDGRFLAVGDTSRDIQIWNAESMRHVKTLTGHKNSVYGLVFRRGTNTLYSASADRSVKVWSLDEMSYVETLFGHVDGVLSIDAMFRERVITAGGRDASIRLWKIADESQLIYNADKGSTDVVRMLNESTFVSGGDSGEILLWGVNKKKALASVQQAHGLSTANNEPLWITSLATFINTDLVASGSSDGHIRLWKVDESSKKLTELFSVPVDGYVNSLNFTSNGSRLIAAVGKEHRLGRWNVIQDAKNCLLIIELQRTVVNKSK